MTLVVAKAMGTSGGEVVYRPEALLLLVWQITDGPEVPQLTRAGPHIPPSCHLYNLFPVFFLSPPGIVGGCVSALQCATTSSKDWLSNILDVKICSFDEKWLCPTFAMQYLNIIVPVLMSSGFANSRIGLLEILQLQKLGSQSVSLTRNMDQLLPHCCSLCLHIHPPLLHSVWAIVFHQSFVQLHWLSMSIIDINWVNCS